MRRVPVVPLGAVERPAGEAWQRGPERSTRLLRAARRPRPVRLVPCIEAEEGGRQRALRDYQKPLR